MITLLPHNRKIGVRQKFIVTDEKRRYWREEQMRIENAGKKK